MIKFALVFVNSLIHALSEIQLSYVVIKEVYNYIIMTLCFIELDRTKKSFIFWCHY